MSRHQFVEPPRTWTACIAPHVKDPDRPRTAAVGLLCAGHHAGLEQHLAELPNLLSDVEDALPRGGGSAGPKVGGTREQPLPFTEAVSDALRAAQAVMASWCLLVLEEHPDGLHAPASDLRAMGRFLHLHLDWCAAQPWVDDLLRETRENTSALRAVLSEARTRRVPLGACDEAVSCDLATHATVTCPGTLTAVVHLQDDALPGAIRCDACGTSHEPETWRALSRRLRHDVEPMLTYAQLSQLLRVPIGTLKRWAHEDGWRRLDTRPSRLRHDDAQQSYEARRVQESA